MNTDMPQFSTAECVHVFGNIYCTKCGTQLERPVDQASSCGSDEAIQATPVQNIVLDQPAQYHPPSESAPQQSSLRGVGGWLLFFCVACTIIAPLKEIAQIRDLDSGNKFSILLVFLFAGIESFVGLSVWRVAQEALQYLKIFFLVRTGLAVLAILAGAITLSGSEALGESESLFIAGFGTIINTAIWWSYFRKSRRVRETFGTNL